MAFSQRCLRPASRLVAAFVLGLALVSAKAAAQDEAPAPADRTERLQAAASLARRTAKLQDFINEVPRISFDPEAVVAAVGTDPEALLGWVAEATRWVPYAGLLRGARGVLMDGRGNGLDRAVLLLELLEHAGHSPRLHRGQLAPEKAEALLAALMDLPLEPSMLGSAEPPTAERIAVAAERMGIAAAELRREILAMQSQAQTAAEEGIQRMLEQSARLERFLDAEKATEVRAKELVEAARCLQDHWWITLETGARLDPLLASLGERLGALEEGADPIAPESLASFASDELDRLPEDLFHTLTVALEVEVTDGRTQKRATALTHTVRVHELVGESLVVQCTPLDHRPPGAEEVADLDDAERGQKVEAALLACGEWLPQILVRERVIEQNSFRADGSLNPKPVRGASAQLIDKASGALAGLGSTRAAKTSEATALFAVYTSRWPLARGAQVERHERIVFDGLGADVRRAAQVDDAPLPRLTADGLMDRALVIGYLADVAPLMCTPSEAYVHGLSYATTLQNREALVGIALAQAEEDPAAALKKSKSAVAKLRPRPVAQWTWGQLRGLYAGSDPRVFVDRPSAFSRFQLLKDDSKSEERWRAIAGYDVIMNHVGVSPTTDDDPLSCSRARLRQGVADTILEAVILKRALPGAAMNTSERFAESHEAWVRAETPPSAAQGDVAADYRSGRAFAPPAPEGAPPPLGCYWRIDSATGDTLGVGPDGRGQVSVEHQILIMFALTVGLTFSCARHDSAEDENLCLAKAACFGLGTLVAGLSMTPFLGGATAAACIAGL